MVWDRIGDVENFCEPFFGSGAVLLGRPHSPRVETVNDLDCHVANFWRSTQHDPEGVVEHCDWPVNEIDLHARHRYLVMSEESSTFREKMRADPDFFDVRFAGWWCWGLCCWIGGGWCTQRGSESEAMPAAPRTKADRQGGNSRGVHAERAPGLDKRKPRIDGGQGQYGHGVHAKGEMPKSKVRISSHNKGSVGKGVHAKGDALHQKRPRSHRAAGSSYKPCELPGVLGGEFVEGGSAAWNQRPQLEDSGGRGVLSNQVPDSTPRDGTCAQRRAWLLDWFGRLRDRFRNVRVCCGHWLRVCDSPSVTTRLGTTGLFLDPPYPTEAKSRSGNLYATDAASGDLNELRDEVLAYCVERGGNPAMRIAVCGYDTDGYTALEKLGWKVEAWKTGGGYANVSGENVNASRERIWFSPHCRNQRGLFDAIPEEVQP